MSTVFNVACIQNCADDDLAANLEETAALSRQAAAAGAGLICLPECFSLLEINDRRMLAAAGAEHGNPAIAHFQDLARELNAWLLLGSVMIRRDSDRVHNRSLMLDPHGAIVARYNKIHLFDVQLSGGESYLESGYVAAGDEAVTCMLPWGTLGLSVCYDLRFAHLYRCLAQAGAEFLSVPAAFTRTTGEAHWHTLIRARAIENGCFVFAPNQCGTRLWGRATFSHSLIVDPWGEVLADGGEEPGYVLAQIDTSRVAAARQRIPALQHDRPFSGPVTARQDTGTGG